MGSDLEMVPSASSSRLKMQYTQFKMGSKFTAWGVEAGRLSKATASRCELVSRSVTRLKITRGHGAPSPISRSLRKEQRRPPPGNPRGRRRNPPVPYVFTEIPKSKTTPRWPWTAVAALPTIAASSPPRSRISQPSSTWNPSSSSPAELHRARGHYKAQLQKGAEIMEWQALASAHSTASAVNTWGRLNGHHHHQPSRSVVVEMSQDLGTEPAPPWPWSARSRRLR